MLKKRDNETLTGNLEDNFSQIFVTCSGKLKLDTERVIFVQKMYNGRHQENITEQIQPRSEQEAYHEIHKRRTPGHRSPDL